MTAMMLLSSLVDSDPMTLVGLSHEYQVIRKGREQSFFSGRTIYDATAFTQTDGGGHETAFLGHVIVTPNGRLGFDPAAVFGDDVHGLSVHDFLTGEIAAGHDRETIWDNFFSGDDVVVGNGYGQDVSGFAGDDVLIATGAASEPYRYSDLRGGDGDDVIFSRNSNFMYGEGGADSFVVDDRLVRFAAWDFEGGTDKVLFDRELFPELGTKITKSEIVFGDAAKDANDRIVIQSDTFFPSDWEVYLDPDGTGEQGLQYLGVMNMARQPTVRDFGMVDAAKLMPDLFELFAGAPAVHAFGVDRAASHAAFAQFDAAPLAHHGLIQLA